MIREFAKLDREQEEGTLSTEIQTQGVEENHVMFRKLQK